jgi:hypothetical protein
MGAEWRPVTKQSGATFAPTGTGFSQGTATLGSYPQGVHVATVTVPSPQATWHKPAPVQTTKIFLANEDVRRIIANLLGTRLAPDFRLFLGDNQYYAPPVGDAQEIIAASGLSQSQYTAESFDCDDFAIVLKARFCRAAYKDAQRRPPHCMGLIWGELPHVHAINWMINDDYKLRFIEPQTGEVFDLRPEHKNITFMMA